MRHMRCCGAFLFDAASIDMMVKHPASCQRATTEAFAAAGARRKAGREHWQEAQY